MSYDYNHANWPAGWIPQFGGSYSYQMNQWTNEGRKITSFTAPAAGLWFFEAISSANYFSTIPHEPSWWGVNAVWRHNGGMNMAFLDGHVEWRKKWEMPTNWDSNSWPAGHYEFALGKIKP